MSGRLQVFCVALGLSLGFGAGEAAASAPEDEVAAPAAPVVDLNAASVEELCTLPGIGPKKAEAIISLREKRPFTRVTQLLLVKGIGPKTLTRLKPRLTVGPVSPRPVPPTGPPSVAEAEVAGAGAR